MKSFDYIKKWNYRNRHFFPQYFNNSIFHIHIYFVIYIKEEWGYGEEHTILHSDQGIVYSSVKFEKANKDYPITRSMSRAGTPTDNPVIESLIGWIKGDLKQYMKPHDFSDIHTAIEIYVHYFNNHRLAYHLNYITPVEYRTINGFT